MPFSVEPVGNKYTNWGTCTEAPSGMPENAKANRVPEAATPSPLICVLTPPYPIELSGFTVAVTGTVPILAGGFMEGGPLGPLFCHSKALSVL